MSLVLSVLLYGCESWTLAADLDMRIQVFDNTCYRRMLGIAYRYHKINEYVWQVVFIIAGPEELQLSTTMIRCRISYYRARWTKASQR